MTIRKNFNFQEETVRQLEELARLNEKTQTQVVQEALEEMYKKIRIKKKLAILDEINDSFHGLLTNVDAKASRIEHVMEKYGK